MYTQDIQEEAASSSQSFMFQALHLLDVGGRAAGNECAGMHTFRALLAAGGLEVILALVSGS